MSTSYSRQRVRGTDIDFDRVAEEPFRAILLHSPGRKPWVIIVNTFIEPQRGGTTLSKTNTCAVCAAPTELNLLLSVFTQGCISGLALITPWALQEYRPCRACLVYWRGAVLCNGLKKKRQGLNRNSALAFQSYRKDSI